MKNVENQKLNDFYHQLSMVLLIGLGIALPLIVISIVSYIVASYLPIYS